MEFIFSVVVVLGMLVLVIVISKIESREEAKTEMEDKFLEYKKIEQQIDFCTKLGYFKDKSCYEIGQWENEIREDMNPIIKITDKYKPNKKISVLVGDYNKSSVSNTVCILESMGISVHIAKSGIEVIERIKNGEKYDLIVSNNIYDRGHCDGPQMVEELKKIDDFNIPIIVLTVSENKRHLFIGEFGFDEYMTKLLTQEQVIEIFPKLIKNLKFIKIEEKNNKSK